MSSTRGNDSPNPSAKGLTSIYFSNCAPGKGKYPNICCMQCLIWVPGTQSTYYSGGIWELGDK